jgi:uncharacterized protein
VSYRFWWDEHNIEHIANHGVEPFEAEAVLDDDPLILRAGGDRYAAYGQSDSGRYLLVVFAVKTGDRIRVITARDLTTAEKKRLRRRRK